MRMPWQAALVAVLGYVLAATTAGAQAPDELWREVRDVDLQRNARARQIVPERYRTFELNRGRLTALLASAPPEQAQRPAQSRLHLVLPRPDGGLETYAVVESPIMEPALAAKYPEIRTYLGQSLDDPTATVRFDVTPKGFHAQVIGADGTTYIDPFQPDDRDHYIVYRKRDHVHGERGICLVTGEPISKQAISPISKVSSGDNLRTYRLAMAATGEYTQFHGGTKLDALSAIVTTMNRVNGIYEREVSVRMVLVANNDLIVYTDAGTDPYSNTNTDLNANQSNIDGTIGDANYDIGHLVGTGGGGVAQLASVCGNGSKARGLTGSGAPIADAFDIDYVAHEMGHQFDGNHTFNGSGGSCAGGNRNATTAYEPGSGITIQAYAGICGGDDLQPNSEDYFHRLSLNEILAFTTDAGTGASCGTSSATGNIAPTVSTTASFTIPGRTPFTLTAAGADANGDALTYVWEQFDLGAANNEGVLDPMAVAGPMFRSFAPTTDATRTFPSWRYILNNANVPPQVAPLPGTTSPPDLEWFTGEVLPNATRTLNFTVTVRDNRAGGGGTNEASTALTVNNLAGPFAVTAPNTAVSLAAGSTQTVTWNVAATNLVPISTANVRITLSIDGGNTFPTELLASTPNDGSQSVTLPSTATTQARVRVEAVGNIYFDVSDTNFTITSANTAPSINVTGAVSTNQGSPTANAVVATIGDAQDAASALGVSVSGAPSELTVSVQNNNGNVTLFATAGCTLVAPTSGNKVYPVLLRVTDSAGAVTTASVNVNVGGNRTPTLDYPVLNMTQNTTRQHAPTDFADANGNLSGTSVSPTTLPGGGTMSIAANGTLTVTTTASTPIGGYTVRAEVGDSCGAVERRDVTINVGAPQITLVASATVLTGNALVEPNECNQVSITLRNDGNTPATGVSGTLSTGTANVSVTQAVAAFPDVPPGESRISLTPYELSTTGAAVCFTNINLSLLTSYSGAGGSPANLPLLMPLGRPLATDYVFTESTGATLPNDGTLVAGSDGNDTTPVEEPIVSVTTPFAFTVYGTTYAAGTALRASTNGNLQFRATKGAEDFSNVALPVAGTGNGQAVFPPSAPTLFLQWDDWRMDVANGGAAAGAGIYEKVEGVAPNRTWIIEWRGRIRGDGSITTNNRAAIVFHEGSNSFDYIYLLTGAGPSSNAAGSTIGVQATAAGSFTQYALNDANLAPGTKLTASLPPALCNAGSGVCGSQPPGVTITPSGGSTNVAEGGATDTYTVVLDAQPSGNVTITMNTGIQVTTAPSPSVSFTTLDWNVPKTVTITAVNDAIAEGAHTGTITHTASGGGYDAVSIANVVANVTDNDTVGVTVTQSGGSTNVIEGGATDSYTVVLTSQPTSDVTITMNPGTQVSTSPTPSLTFTTVDWNSPKTVTVTAVDDALAEGIHTGTITHSASGGGYTGVSIASVTANITDNDTAGVTVTQSGTTDVVEGGATDSYTLVLTSQPTSNVTITVTPDGQVTTSGNLSFTSGDWNVPKTVTVTAVNDAVFEGAHTGTITHSASGGGYTGVSIANVVANIVDNDVDLAVSSQTLSVAVAGQRLTYGVTVDNLTAANVAAATFDFSLPALLTNVSWTCVADPGASCPANGTGAPSHTIALAANTGVVYEISADVPAGTPDGTPIATVATISVAAPTQDIAAANNSDSTSDTVVPPSIFRNGFE